MTLDRVINSDKALNDQAKHDLFSDRSRFLIYNLNNKCGLIPIRGHPTQN